MFVLGRRLARAHALQGVEQAVSVQIIYSSVPNHLTSKKPITHPPPALNVSLGFMNCITFARRALASSASSAALALRFRDVGVDGVDTFIVAFTARVRCGSGSRQRGGAVAS